MNSSLHQDQSRKKILLVDDDSSLRNVVADCLAEEGFHVVQAGKVQDAIGTLKAARFDLVILDLTLPDGTGMEVLKQVKSLGYKCPVIVLTGSPGLGVALESMTQGAADYVKKPVKIPYLVKSMKRILSKEKHETLS